MVSLFWRGAIKVLESCCINCRNTFLSCVYRPKVSATTRFIHRNMKKCFMIYSMDWSNQLLEAMTRFNSVKDMTFFGL